MTTEEYRLAESLPLAGTIPAGTLIRIEKPPAMQPMYAFDPHEVAQWLYARGWSQQGTKLHHPERFAFKQDTLQVYDMTWEQAVAYEMFRFLNMGAR